MAGSQWVFINGPLSIDSNKCFTLVYLFTLVRITKYLGTHYNYWWATFHLVMVFINDRWLDGLSHVLLRYIYLNGVDSYIVMDFYWRPWVVVASFIGATT